MRDAADIDDVADCNSGARDVRAHQHESPAHAGDARAVRLVERVPPGPGLDAGGHSRGNCQFLGVPQ